MNLRVVEKLQLGRLVTPLPDRRQPVYSWFPVKEAFSRDLVHLLAGTWGLKEGDLVLDPFVGSGTTLLACRELGLDSLGFDVHPVMLFVSRVKLREYDVGELRKAIGELTRAKPVKGVEAPGFAARVFPKPVLEDIFSLKRAIGDMAEEGIREFLLLGLAIAAMKCSWAHKDGAAIKVVRHPLPPLRRALERQLLLMCRDLQRFRAKPAGAKVEHCDARKLELGEESVDAVITSPPYLGKQEYIHEYRIEQWILGLDPPRSEDLIGIRAGDASGEDFSEVAELVGDERLEVKLYFKDMLAAIRELHRVCRRGASVCMVASDGCFREGTVEVCGTLSRLAERAGFRAKRMIVVNRRFCTTPSRKKIGVARESLLIWEKP